MRLRNMKGAREAVSASAWCVKDAQAWKGRWRTLFPDADVLEVEIGSGKGRFLIESARRNRNRAYIGIERYSTVIYKALRKLPDDAPGNLRFVLLDAVLLETVFADGEIDRIYLNFSDPWPKARHAERRLTSRTFLSLYDRVLAPGGRVEFKTDNRALFDWSVEQIAPAGFSVSAITYDLHADEILAAGNVMTEYEERFSSAGHPICKYVIVRSENGGKNDGNSIEQ